jgi:biopolymer transport protein ExbD/biopolymer transport protein TolR
MAMALGGGGGGGHHRGQRSMADINITPFVDVVLVLLIIFMVTAPILQSGIEVNVPKTKTVKEISQERLVITIDRQQKVYLGNDPINVNEIADRLRSRVRDPQNQVIYLRADENVPFGAFATVMDSVKQSGITQVSIVTEPLNASGRNR